VQERPRRPWLLLAQQLRKYQDPNDPDALVRAPVTGEMRALRVLADDLYQLAHALEPPRAILARLRDIRQFQGARYEILAASLFARCGFKIDFIEMFEHRHQEGLQNYDTALILTRISAGTSSAMRERSPLIRRVADAAPGTSLGPKPSRWGFPTVTSNRLGFPRCSMGVSATNSNRRVRTRTHGGVAGVGG
jgi:hypothetical protein